MYRCLDCRATFAYPEEKDAGHEPYEFWGERGYRRMVIWVCPECECDEIEPYDEENEVEIEEDE